MKLGGFGRRRLEGKSLGPGFPSLDALQDAVRHEREISRGQPTPGLGAALNALAQGFGILRRFEEALTASEESVRVRRSLAGLTNQDPSGLARSLTEVASSLRALGRNEEALAAFDESVELRRELVAREPDEGRRLELAMALLNRCSCLCAMSRPQDGLEAVGEAIPILLAVGANRPDQFRPYLASANSLRSKCLAQLDSADQILQEEPTGHGRSRAPGPSLAFRFADRSSPRPPGRWAR